MKADVIAAAGKPGPSAAGKPGNTPKPELKKPTGPITYTVTKGADLFWFGRRQPRQ